jgi:hypothetical protein
MADQPQASAPPGHLSEGPTAQPGTAAHAAHGAQPSTKIKVPPPSGPGDPKLHFKWKPISPVKPAKPLKPYKPV